jgi:hypothetical protein
MSAVIRLNAPYRYRAAAMLLFYVQKTLVVVFAKVAHFEDLVLHQMSVVPLISSISQFRPTSCYLWYEIKECKGVGFL